MTNSDQPLAPPLTDRVLRLPQVVEAVGLSPASIYRLVGQGRFPRPVALSAQARGWRASAIQGWLDGLEPAGAQPDTEGA